MLSAQLLLTVFIGYWLQGEYRSEKSQLRSALELNIDAARRESIDSLIRNKIISPLLMDAGAMKIKIDVKDTMATAKVSPLNLPDSLILKDDITIPSEPSGKVKHEIILNRKSEFQKDVIHNGLKLIIKKSMTTSDDSSFLEDVYFMKSDSAAFRITLDSFLKRNKLPLTPTWLPASAIHSGADTVIFFSSESSELPENLTFSSANHYLLIRILPQMLSGLILLLLTGLAFYFSFRNLKKQISLEKIKSEMLSNISHELKTPVSTVKIAIEELRNIDPLKEEQRFHFYISTAQSEMNRLELMIEKVMNSSLLEEGKIQLHKESIDLPKLIIEIVDQFQLRNQHSLKIKTEFHTLPNPVIHADRLHFTGVLVNIVDNAIKYGPAEQTILISCSNEEGLTKICVSDEGPGIPEEYQSRIFDKFFRVPSNNIHEVKGYGLGLNYAMNIMKLHHGSISYHRSETKGSLFTITLPKA